MIRANKRNWHSFFVPNRLCWKNWEEFINRGNADQTYTPPEPQKEIYKDKYFDPMYEKLSKSLKF